MSEVPLWPTIAGHPTWGCIPRERHVSNAGKWLFPVSEAILRARVADNVRTMQDSSLTHVEKIAATLRALKSAGQTHLTAPQSYLT